MSWDYTPYVLPLFLSGVMAAAFALYTWRRAQARAKPLIALMIAGAVWSLGHAAELMGADLSSKLFWTRFQCFGIGVVPVAWLAVALQHSGKEHAMTRRALVLLMIVPAAALALVWTNEGRGLIWRDMSLHSAGPFSVLAVVHGPGFWAWIAYSYTLFLVGGILLALTAVHSPALYFRQRIVLLLALAFPWAASVLYLSRLGPSFDLTPFAFAASALAMALGVFRLHLTDVVQLARSAVMEKMRDAVIVLDRRNRIIDVNPQAEKMIDASLDDVIGLPVKDVFARSPLLIERLAGDSDADVEITLGTHEEPCVYVARVSAIRNRRETPIGRLIVCHDITERKRAEEARLRLERQVQHAQRLESLGVMAGGIAHDFNNILMAVLGYADLAIQDLSETHPARASVRAIEKAGKRAAALTRQMLAYSGRGEFIIEEMAVSTLMDDMAHLLRTSISPKIALNLHLDRDLPPIKADVAQMQQVVLNLITNASEAIGDATGAIVLSTGQMDCDRACLDHVNEVLRAGLDEPLPEGVYVYLEVSDTGCGMDEETRTKIFEPFFTTKFTGRGLGMAAVLGIVRGHRGAIMLDTEPGKGTTFRVLFPAVEGRRVDAAEQERGETRTEEHQERGTILVVDDEAMVRDLATEILERQGFTVLTAADGREALEVYRAHTDEIACVLLDLTMPHMDGEQCFRELRQIKSDVRVILSSGYNEQDATQRFAGLGLAGFIHKPYQSATLNARLRAVLQA